jgi:hypothetical protein
MKARYALFAYYALVIAYGGYAAYSYTGLYRLAAEWQMQAFGSYESKLTFFAPVLILMLPVALVERIFGLGPKKRSVSARAAVSGPSRASAASSRLPVVLALIGLIAMALAAGAGLLGYRISLAQNNFETVDLGNNGAPGSAHVVMTAVAQTEYILKFETTVGGTTRVDAYVPLTPQNWRRGDPLVYFLKTNATVYLPAGEFKPLAYARETPPFRMTTQPATLVRNALPGPIVEGYRKRGIALAEPQIVLDLDQDADAQPYFVAMGVLGLIGLCCLVTAAMAALQRPRVARI